MKIKSLSEVMGLLDKDLATLANTYERANVLRTVKPEIKSLLMLQYDPRIEFDLPPGKPVYKAIWSDENQNVLYNLIQKKYFKYFIKGSDLYINKPDKRQQVFIDSVKNMYVDDAEMIFSIKNKENIWPSITYDVLVMAYPDIVKGWNGKCRIKDAMVELNNNYQAPETLTVKVIDDTLNIMVPQLSDSVVVEAQKKGRKKVK